MTLDGFHGRSPVGLAWCLVLPVGQGANLICIITSRQHLHWWLQETKKRGPSLAGLRCSPAFQRAVLILAESARCGFIAYLTHGMHRAARWWFIRSHSIRALHLSFDPGALRGVIGAQSNSIISWESEILPWARRVLRDPVTDSANRLLTRWKGNILHADAIQAS